MALALTSLKLDHPDAAVSAPSGGQDAEDVAVHVAGVSHRYLSRNGGEVKAVDYVDLVVPKGQFVAIVGASGCGKTSVLNMMAGLVSPSTGQVLLNGKPVVGTSRSVGYMFAKDGLLPWRTARANVSFGLEVRGTPREERNRRAQALLEEVGLGQFGNAFPSQLSHGMRQRAALARTMAIDPEIFLLDEPFAALDAQTKVVLQEEFVRIWEESRKTVVLVTHDISEAVAMADRVIVFSPRPGRIRADIMIDLPRPRDIEGIRYDDKFVKIARRVWLELGHSH